MTASLSVRAGRGTVEMGCYDAPGKNPFRVDAVPPLADRHAVEDLESDLSAEAADTPLDSVSDARTGKCILTQIV